jgi:amino acid adenylation domain-containing protein
MDAPIPTELLQTLFVAQVENRAQQPAVIASQRSLSYQELFDKSNQLGHWLRHLGVRKNTLIPIVMEKGWEQVVAALGVLHAGAAYVPIDPQLPKERLWYLLEHSEAEVVLTQPWLDDRLEWPKSIERLCVDDVTLEAWSKRPLPVKQTPDDLAFVIYTSGSTGLPKGVMINHRGAVNTIVQTNARFAIAPEDRVLAVTAFHHDMSAFDLFGLLAAGGTMVMPEAERRRDPGHWVELMRQEGVTIWNSVPAMMSMLVEYVAARELPLTGTLRLAFLGGDWIPLDLPTRIKTLAEGAQVVSVGGPTEITIWNICYPVTSIDPSWKSIPYGKPFPNSRYYILNEALDDCPVWVPGEMYCAGAGVAQGYWRDQEKTRASFFTHQRTGERLYRTGDLGRYLPDGNIEFLGRADSQVKILGQRIELGEIELTLKQHEKIGAAVVLAAGELRGEKRLLAYYVPRQDSDPSTDELREFLKQKLPAHMVPAVWTKLASLPLTANGKVDRRALPTPEQLPAESKGTFVAPRNPIEQQVTTTCAQVLKCESIGVHDDFFARGGNSLTAIQLISRLRSEFEVEVPLVELFNNPTMAHLAAAIMRVQIEQADQEYLTKMVAAVELLSDAEVEAFLLKANHSADGQYHE